MSDKSLLLSSLSSRGKNYGISTAAGWLKSLEGCFGDGFCPTQLMKSVSREQWNEGLKAAQEKLTYCVPGMNVKSIAPESVPNSRLTFDCVVTTSRKDRDLDILDTRGAMLDQQSPLLFNHNPFLPIGRVIRQLSHTENKLTARCAIAEFSGDGELATMAKDVATLIEFGALRISHGFDPHAFSPLDEKDGRWLVSKFTILEVSAVPIPSNVEATILAFSKGTLKLRNPLVKGWAQKKLSERPAQGRGVTFENNGKGRLAIAAEKSDPIRWNPRLSKAFDVATAALEPATDEYDWVSRYLEVPVKKIFQTSTIVPSARMGSFLMGLRGIVSESKCDDVRNMTGNGTEAPPVHEIVQLNSKLSDSFLIDGISFYRGRECKFVTSVSPFWGGVKLTAYVDREQRDYATDLFDKAWAFARANNFLKGEAFSLSGEFLPRGDQKWEDVFLTEKNEKPLRRIVALVNQKQKSCPNRGVVMMGPPGTGKTLAGRIMKNEAQSTFIWVSARDFYHSGSFGGFAYAFELAKELTPSILFVEDVDNWMSDHTVDLLKTEMDGIAKSSGLVTILTTNFPERFPEALIDRPGRFHDVLKFDLPDRKTRNRMLNQWMPNLSEAELKTALDRTDGFSGAHVYELSAFAKTIQEQDDLGLGASLIKALDKIEEQRELITSTHLSGSRYQPRRRQDHDEAISFRSKSHHDCHCGGKCNDCRKSADAGHSVRHEGESAEDCVSRKIEILMNEGGRTQAECEAIAYSMCGAKNNQPVTEPKDNTMSTTKDMGEPGPNAPAHDREEEMRFLGQGPQQGNRDVFTERHAANDVEGETLTGVSGFQPSDSGDDETLALATGQGSGKRNPEDPLAILPEGEDLTKAGVLPERKDPGVIEPMGSDEDSHHDLNGAVDGRIHLEKAVREAAMKIRHSGKEGAAYLHHETKSVHHVAHESDLHPSNAHLYDTVHGIVKMYASAHPHIKNVHVAMHHPEMGSGYAMVHAGGPQGMGHTKGKTLTKVGRVLSAKNLKRLTEATKHLEHVGTLGDSHVSSIAMPHLKLAHAHVAEVVKEANSLDPNGEGVYAESKVPPEDTENPTDSEHFGIVAEDAGNPGNAPHFNVDPTRDDPQLPAGFGARRIDPDTLMQVTRPNIPGSVSIEDLIVKTMLSLDLADRESIAALKTACDEELSHRKNSDSDFLEELMAHAELES